MQAARAKAGPGLPVPPTDRVKLPMPKCLALSWENPRPCPVLSKPQLARMLNKARWVTFQPMRSSMNLDLQPPSPLLSPGSQGSGCSCFLWPGCSLRPPPSVGPRSCCASPETPGLCCRSWHMREASPVGPRLIMEASPPAVAEAAWEVV